MANDNSFWAVDDDGMAQKYTDPVTASMIHDDVQGVVTYMSPVEAFATTIKFFDRQKVCLIA